MTRYRVRCKASGAWLSPVAFEFMSLAVLHAYFTGYDNFEIVLV